MIKTISLCDLDYSTQKQILIKSTEVFPENKRIKISSKQIKNLVENYKVKIHYIWNIENNLKNTIFQITWESFIWDEYWKIILWNLQKYKLYFNNFNDVIKKMTLEQLKYYDNLTIESSGNIFDKYINNNFILLDDIWKIKEILKIFIPINDSYKYDNIILNENWVYSRKVWTNWEVTIKKKMYIKN